MNMEVALGPCQPQARDAYSRQKLEEPSEGAQPCRHLALGPVMLA